MHPGTKYLDTFIAAVETGSFVRAAQRQHVTQSTVSYQIKQLEQWLGAPVFERAGRKLILTALGEALYGYCERFVTELATLRGGASGTGVAAASLRIATGSSFGRHVLTPLLTGALFDHTLIELRFGSDDEVFAAVANGQADLGFSYTLRASGLLTFEAVYTEQLVLTAPLSERTRHTALATWLAASSFITYDESDPVFTRWFETTLGTMPARVRAVGHCSELEETLSMVAAGRGLSIMPRHAIGKAAKVRIIEPRGAPTTANTVFCVRREGSALSDVAQRLLELIKR
jgi:DNA-binding transcriptional LysR family regulator